MKILHWELLVILWFLPAMRSSDISSSRFFHCVLSPLTQCDGSIWPSTETSETMREEKLFLHKFDCFMNYFVIVLKKWLLNISKNISYLKGVWEIMIYNFILYLNSNLIMCYFILLGITDLLSNCLKCLKWEN